MAHTLDALASEPQYVRALRPILAALPHDARGTLYVPARLIDRVTGLGWHVVGRRPAPVPESPTPRPILVASFQDARTARPRGYVLADHGAGQSYAGEPRTARHPSYSGGDEHERCLLFLCPNEAVAARWRAAYPDTLAPVVGYPALDRLHGRRLEACAGSLTSPGESADGSGASPTDETRPTDGPTPTPSGSGMTTPLSASTSPPTTESVSPVTTESISTPGPKPVVAVSFHANIALCPETKSAWPHYNPVLPATARDPRWHLLGHGHPRLYGRIERRWRELGVEHTPDFDEVLARASCFVVDNSSTLYEFASLDRPVVVLNAPWYRRDAEHGLRFWSEADVGMQVDEPAALPDAIALALTDPPGVAQRRREIVERVMPLRDGRGAQRAVEAICGVLNGTLVG